MIKLPDTNTGQGQREASVLLARLCGWLTKDKTFYNYFPPNGKGASVNRAKGHDDWEIFSLCPTLYKESNMALAWCVLNWAHNNLPGNTGASKIFYDFLFAKEYFEQLYIWAMPPNEAQRAWLDKILELANEAGMLEGES